MNATNTVDVDPAALAREAEAVDVPQDTPAPAPDAPAADSAASAQNAQPGVPGELSPDEAEQRARALAPQFRGFLDGFARTVIPAWELTEDEKAALAHQFALVAVYWWPDLNLPPKWAAIVSAGLLTYAVIEQRRDTDGNLLPRKIERAQRPASAPQGANNKKSEAAGSGFTTTA